MATKEKYFKSYQESLLRANLIRKELMFLYSDIELKNYFKNKQTAEGAYIATIEQLIKKGYDYLSLNPESKTTIQVSLDIEKYSNILKNLKS